MLCPNEPCWLAAWLVLLNYFKDAIWKELSSLSRAEMGEWVWGQWEGEMRLNMGVWDRDHPSSVVSLIGTMNPTRLGAPVGNFEDLLVSQQNSENVPSGPGEARTRRHNLVPHPSLSSLQILFQRQTRGFQGAPLSSPVKHDLGAWSQAWGRWQWWEWMYWEGAAGGPQTTQGKGHSASFCLDSPHLKPALRTSPGSSLVCVTHISVHETAFFSIPKVCGLWLFGEMLSK